MKFCDYGADGRAGGGRFGCRHRAGAGLRGSGCGHDFPEAMTDLAMYRQFADAVKVPVLANITEFGATPLYTQRAGGQRRVAGAVSAVVVPRREQGR